MSHHRITGLGWVLLGLTGLCLGLLSLAHIDPGLLASSANAGNEDLWLASAFAWLIFKMLSLSSLIFILIGYGVLRHYRPAQIACRFLSFAIAAILSLCVAIICDTGVWTNTAGLIIASGFAVADAFFIYSMLITRHRDPT